MSAPADTDLPEHTKEALETLWPADKLVEERTQHLASVQPRKGDLDGDTEILDGVTYTHHFVDAPGDYDTVRWHYTECGEGEPIVFLQNEVATNPGPAVPVPPNPPVSPPAPVPLTGVVTPAAGFWPPAGVIKQARSFPRTAA